MDRADLDQLTPAQLALELYGAGYEMQNPDGTTSVLGEDGRWQHEPDSLYAQATEL